MIWQHTLGDSHSTQLQGPIGRFSGELTPSIKNLLPAWCVGPGREGVNGVNFLTSKLLISIVLCFLNYTGCPKIKIVFRILDNF